MDLRAVFLDRDGVLNVDLPGGVVRREDFAFLPGALDAVARLTRAGLPIFIITNQANVGRGVVSRSLVEDIHARMLETIRVHGGAIAGLYACFHAPEDGCACRKPAPGLLEQAAREHSLDLARVAFVGDDGRDLEAAVRAGARPFLVLTGKGRTIEPRVRSGELLAEAVLEDLAAFARRAVPD
ncbi:MAG: D-glycero-alpha-D-manno-heptose-1,7-bisphosphate 7-phosphatase [Planctomycetota bacterium]